MTSFLFTISDKNEVQTSQKRICNEKCKWSWSYIFWIRLNVLH